MREFSIDLWSSNFLKFCFVTHDQLCLKKNKITDAAIDFEYINHVKIEI